MKDYQKSFTVNKSVREVYAAITEHISDWWSNDLSGTAAQKGDSFTIAFNKTQKTMHIAEAVPDKQIIWKCDKAHIDVPSLKNKSEWVDTRMIWNLSPAKDGTTLDFLHEGLNKSLECYKVCESGWDQFLASLKMYVTTGKGMPFLKAEGTKQLAEK
jgi:uncharacterized protein YndB with AHSA1/START domain